MTYTIAECTVINSWWWTEELSETCRVSIQNKFENSATSWFYYKEICHDVWSHEPKIYCLCAHIYIRRSANGKQYLTRHTFTKAVRSLTRTLPDRVFQPQGNGLLHFACHFLQLVPEGQPRTWTISIPGPPWTILLTTTLKVFVGFPATGCTASAATSGASTVLDISTFRPLGSVDCVYHDARSTECEIQKVTFSIIWIMLRIKEGFFLDSKPFLV
jgi:hypothetical protein